MRSAWEVCSRRRLLCSGNLKAQVSLKKKRIVIQMHVYATKHSLLKRNQPFSTRLESIHGLATVFAVQRQPRPIHSQIQPKETGHYTHTHTCTHTLSAGIPCQLNHRKKPNDLGSQWAPDAVGDIIMSSESYAQWPCITLWKSPNS